MSAVYIAATIDLSAVGAVLGDAGRDPLGLTLALSACAAAFVVRAELWRGVPRRLSFVQALAAIYVALAGNHILPLRLGEPLRVISAVRRARVPVAEAAQPSLPLQEGDRVPGARGPVGGADSGGPAAQDDQAWASGAQAGTAAVIAPAG